MKRKWKPWKNLGTICSALLPHAPEGICCCQKLLLGFFSASYHQCFIAFSASLPCFSMLTLISLSPSSTTQTKTYQSLLPEWHHLWFCFWHGPVHLFAWWPPSSASCYREFVWVLATTFTAGQRWCHALVGNVQPNQLQWAWRKSNLSVSEGRKIYQRLVRHLFYIHFLTAFGGHFFFF